MQLLFRAGPPLLRVRFVGLVALACACGSVWASLALFHNYGLAPIDGGVLRPLSERLLVSGFVALLGLAFAIGMAVYGRCYVALLEYDAQTDTLRFTLAGLLWPSRMEVERAQLRAGGQHGGAYGGPIRGYAAWHALYREGRRLPFILDDSGELFDRQALEALWRV